MGDRVESTEDSFHWKPESYFNVGRSSNSKCYFPHIISWISFYSREIKVCLTYSLIGKIIFKMLKHDKFFFLCGTKVLLHFKKSCFQIGLSVRSDSLWPHGLWPISFLCPWDSPGKNTGGGLPFPSPGDLSNPGIKPTSSIALLWVKR